MPDALKALGKHVEQKPADKLLDREHRSTFPRDETDRQVNQEAITSSITTAPDAHSDV